MTNALDQFINEGKNKKENFLKSNNDVFVQTDNVFADTQPERLVKPNVKPSSEFLNFINEGKELKEEKKDFSYLSYADKVYNDVMLQPIGGVIDAAESLINLALPKEKEIEISDWVGEAQTGVGQFIRPASQFLIPYTNAYKIANTGFLFVKNAKNLKKTTEAINKFNKTNKNVKAKIKSVKPFKSLSYGQKLAIGGGAGMGVDYVFFGPNDPNLGDLMVQFPATKNVVSEWLATNPNGDPGMERLKNALSGAIPGFAIPLFLRGTAKGFSWSANPIVKGVKKSNDELTIKENKEITQKIIDKGEEVDIDVIKRDVAKKRTLPEKTTRFLHNTFNIKKHVVEYLDNVRGIKYLMDVAEGKGVKGLTGKNKIGAYKEARFLPAIGGMIEHFLTKQTFRLQDGMLVSTGRDGLQPLLEKNLGKGADVNDYFNYQLSKDLLSLDDDTFKGLYPKNTAQAKAGWQKIADAGDKKANYTRTLTAVKQFNDDLLQFAVDTNMITKATKEMLIKKRPHHIGLYRDVSDDELFLRKTGANKLRTPMKARVAIGKGEDQLPLANPFDNFLENVTGIITSSYKNHVKLQTFDIIDSAKAQGKSLDDWATEVGTVSRFKVKVKPDELKREIKKQNIELDLNDLDDLDELALYRSQRVDVGPQEDFVFKTIIKDGKEQTVRKLYKINNELLDLSLNSITPKLYYPTHGAVKVAQFVKDFLTKGVTLDPGFFAYANLLRDTFSAAILSKNPFHLPVINTAMSVVRRFSGLSPAETPLSIVKIGDKKMTMKELYDEFILNGGSFASTLYSAEVSDTILKTLYRKMGHSDYASNVLNTPKKMYDNYTKVVSGFENASRFTEYRLLRQAGYSAREASFGAREVAVDFGMHGANHWFRQYVSTVPFMNAGLQGLYRTVRALTSEGSTQRALVVSKLTAFVTVPTLGLYAMNRNNPDYWNQSQQVRDLNYLLPFEGGWIKIPKPFEFGAIGTITESLAETFDKTGNADKFFTTFWHVMKHQTRIPFVPQVISPILNTTLNRNFFGAPIIPENMKNTIPDFGKSYPWTNKFITMAIENAPPWLRDSGLLLSPIEFENYFRAYTGAIGGFFLDGIDEASELFTGVERPDKRWDELPFLKRFLQLDPSKYTQAEQEFYELKTRATKIVNQMKKFKDEQKFDLLQDFMADPENQELMMINGRLEAIAGKLSAMNRQRNKVINDKTLKGDEKRRILDEYEKVSGQIFDSIMKELESQDLEIYQPIFTVPQLFN